MEVETVVSLSNPARDIIGSAISDAGLVLYFLSPGYQAKKEYLAALATAYPKASLLGCSTGGEIAEHEAFEQSAVCVAIRLEHSRLKMASMRVSAASESYAAGCALAKELAAPDLRLMFVLSDGLCVNGSDLVRGITAQVGPEVTVTGGLAADGDRFRETGVGLDGLPESNVVGAAGFYGPRLRISYGSVGGWIKFGPERLITRAHGKVLYELDGTPALDLYKKYLGEDAEKLPGSGLLFPLSICPPGERAHDVVRTIVGVDEEKKSLLFAGDVPQGYVAQLMRGDMDNLVDGAEQAARLALADAPSREQVRGDTLGILVSCIGRSLLMGQQTSNEVEAIARILRDIPIIGFYSYGEICPQRETHRCSLHNQTMTITLLSEVA